MSDESPATRADLAALRGEVYAIRDQFGTLRDEHGRRIVELERGRTELHDLRRLVTQLHERIRETTGAVATVMERLDRQDVNTSQVIRNAMGEMRDQFTAAVRAEMVGVRDEVKELHEDVAPLRADIAVIKTRLDARPCVGAECPIPGEGKEVEGA